MKSFSLAQVPQHLRQHPQLPVTGKNYGELTSISIAQIQITADDLPVIFF